jgi:hypothetical protein
MPGWVGTAGWIAAIVAGMYMNDQYFKQGWRQDDQDGTTNFLGGYFSSSMDASMRALGFSDRLASLLSGSSLTARLLGHGPRHEDAFGVRGSIAGGAFSGENWQDWSRRGGTFRGDIRGTDASALDSSQVKFWANFMSSIGDITGILGRITNVDVGSVLSGYSRDVNLQFSENGEVDPAKIKEMYANLMGEVLQDQVALVLRAGGSTRLAEYIEELDLAGQELADSVIAFVAMMEAVPSFDLNGLTMEALMDWQRSGESLEDTFARVAQQITEFDNAFTSDAQKLDRAQRMVANGFRDLNIAIPDSEQSFYDLVHGIDVSTEAGRDLFDALMKLAPSFLVVSDAAAAAMDAFDALMGRLRGPGYTAQVQGMQMTSFLTQFQGANQWASGLSQSFLLEQLRTITREDFASYSASNQQLILAILGLDETMTGSTEKMAVLFENANYVAPGPSSQYMSIADAIVGRIEGIAGSASGLGDSQLSEMLTRRSVLSTEMQKLMARKSELEAYTSSGQVFDGSQALRDEYTGIAEAIARLQAMLGGAEGLSDDIGRISELIGAHGATKGEKLFALEEWYEEQRAQAQDNADALAAIEAEYWERRNEIMEEGVNGSIEDAERARESLRAWLDNLLLDPELSTLGPADRFAEAESQFNKILELARGGDAEAIGQLDEAASSYLELARMLFASSADYAGIFSVVMEALSEIAGSGLVEPDMEPDPLLPPEMLPKNGSQLASNQDIAVLSDQLGGVLTVSDPALVAAIQQMNETLQRFMTSKGML